MADEKDKQTVVRKRSDAYTGLLAISFLAMVGGSVLLYLEYQNYEGKAPPKAPEINVPGAQLKAIPGSGNPPPPAPKKDGEMPPADNVMPPGDNVPPPKDMAPPPKDMPAEIKDMVPPPKDMAPLKDMAPPKDMAVPKDMPAPLKDMPKMMRGPKPETTVPVSLPDPVIQIPDVPGADGPPVTPASATRRDADLKPIIPTLDPSSSEPPLPVKRFVPPM
jgi:hypothetical protein